VDGLNRCRQLVCRIALQLKLGEAPTYFLNILRKVFSFEVSSGARSAPGAATAADVEVSVDIVEGAVDGAGEG
jgi:hypothetical protein